ncbi:fungal-specific transcription factor domain-containing protein [Mariannaea sp. PMI_226]|nr:fungal-specific transcription factor domain-containing protein [Mariannaea sp. PMI_226]
MVVMDDDHNGWRHLVLPMAWADDLIMNAVLSASAFHLASRGAGEHVVDPQKLYGRAIRELQQRRDLVECDHKTKQAVILTIVILLVAVMINGCSDFPIIFQMLESALKAVGGESKFLDGGETGNFFLRQIRKMRVYAAPLLSQDAGLHAIIYHGSDSFDCLHYYDQLHPTQSSTFKTIADLRQQAFDIYLDRVLAGGSSTASRGVLDRFIATVQSFTEGSLGENVLVWPVFIAALESCSLEHRAIFEQFLRRQHQRNGFGNILRALELLKTIWARKSNKDWPAILPEPQVFVM